MGWFADFIKGVLKANGGSVSVTTKLGSGYSVEAERKMNLQKLEALCSRLPSKYPPKGKETYCNFAAIEACNDYGNKDLDGLNANQMASRLATLAASGKTWRKDTGTRATQHAQKGGLAFAVKTYPEHGHIALVAPRAMQKSGSWGKDIPMIANVGKTNGIMKTSEGFPVSGGEPEYYLLEESAA